MPKRSFWVLVSIGLWLSGCTIGPGHQGSVSDVKHLTDNTSKTWKMTKIVIASKLQPLSDGIKVLTRTYHADGTWTDNLANKGIWRIDGDRFFLEETTQKHSPFRKDPKPQGEETRSVRIVSLKNKLMILEFDNLDIGTGVRGFATVYLEPTNP